MPLVLTQAEVTESGHAYADELGKQYEFPPRYRKLIVPGAGFIYYRPRRGKEGRNLEQAYLGAGLIGTVAASPSSGLLLALIAAYESFESPVAFKQKGRYLEPEANDREYPGTFFQVGVRRITPATFAAILEAAGT